MGCGCCHSNPLGWDSDLAAILLHLLPPTAKGKKTSVKISVTEAADRVIKFMKVCGDEHSLTELDQHSPSSFALEKRRVVFISFPGPEGHSLHGTDSCGRPCTTYIHSTTMYGIDVGTAKESPRVKEIRKFEHLKFRHALYPGRTLRLKCGEHGCSSVFYTYCGFKKHLLRVHGDCVASGSVDNLDSETMFVFLIHYQVQILPSVTQLLLKKGKLLDMCSSIIAQVQASGVSESTVQSLVGSMEELVNDVHVQAQDAVLKCHPSEVTEQAVDKVKDCFEQLENPFLLLISTGDFSRDPANPAASQRYAAVTRPVEIDAGQRTQPFRGAYVPGGNPVLLVNTETKRQRYFEKKCKMVEPVEHVLGECYYVKDQILVYTVNFQSMTNSCMYLFWELLSQCLPTGNSATVSSK
ncbi:hypothetical protein N1851_026844 [Merluccius polli]|uniref:C2H2-type domain-containing protein n=1 Tax=Merluccius polli TaxID=89951 RepID=A0AA47MB08_MERPO|nr:hypothetical protein N1851_026844 [Merluccius polli]